ncbi:hypothetical protein [Streptacidiphilus sp. EB129]|uniref:hypothetical protein n=1 Tax=Streptacidiphilus sp. EB129 TaxID=3156262 RepID=UPI003517D89D
MSSDIEVDFAQELRAVAESAVQPNPADLYAGAVQRGGRIRRRTRVRRSLVGAATLGVVAAVGIPLLGGTASTASVGAAASSTVMGGTTPGAKGTEQTAGTPGSTAWMPAYMVQTLRSLLPAGSSTAVEDDVKDTTVKAYGPWLGMAGNNWGGMVQSGLATSNGTSSIELSTFGFAGKHPCPTRAQAPHEDCTSTSLDGGTLVVDKGFKNPVNGEGATLWDVYWYGPEGGTVHVGQVTDASHPATQAAPQALTAEQMVTMAMAPAWDRVWKSLPEPCRFGLMVGTPSTPTPPWHGLGLVCATSQAAALPMHGSDGGIAVAG